MAEHTIKLPDFGEGVAEAELVEWCVKVGDTVKEDETLGAVMTDKANVEIPASCDGTVTWLGADTGDIVAVGSDIVRISISHAASSPRLSDTSLPVEVETDADKPLKPNPNTSGGLEKPGAQRCLTTPPPKTKVLASPAVRDRARKNGVDLSLVTPSGAGGRIRQLDLTSFIENTAALRAGPRPSSLATVVKLDGAETQKIVGLRRKIAEKMETSARSIPHICYVEEVDMSNVEALRKQLNADEEEGQHRLTIIPFLAAAIVKAIKEVPQVNAHFNEALGELYRYEDVHIGVATQTDNGLVVPVVKNAQDLDIWQFSSEVSRLANGAREAKSLADELRGSTITISSLGAMGGIATTPIINHPEVAIVGVNKLQTLPKWDGSQFQPRLVMNLSSSFDHRVIDGWDAAVFIQKVREYLESPALIFLNRPKH